MQLKKLLDLKQKRFNEYFIKVLFIIKVLENFPKIYKIRKITIEQVKDILEIVFIKLNKNKKDLIKTKDKVVNFIKTYDLINKIYVFAIIFN